MGLGGLPELVLVLPAEAFHAPRDPASQAKVQAGDAFAPRQPPIAAANTFGYALAHRKLAAASR
jgi:uncharacterized membrane-anchored protein